MREAAAPARQMAMETARILLAPNLDLDQLHQKKVTGIPPFSFRTVELFYHQAIYLFLGIMVTER